MVDDSTTAPTPMATPPAVIENALAGGALSVASGPSNASVRPLPPVPTLLALAAVSGSGGARAVASFVTAGTPPWPVVKEATGRSCASSVKPSLSAGFS